MPSNKIRDFHKKLGNRILNLLKESPRFQAEILRALKLKNKKEINLAYKTLEKLERSKAIVKDRKNILKAVSASEIVIGKITITPQGFGFVTPINAKPEDKDIFIPAKHVNSAFDRDMVKVKIIGKDKYASDKGPVGIVCEVIERYRPGIVGELISGRNGLALRPLNRRIPDNIRVVGSTKGAVKGDWVKANLRYKNDIDSRYSTTVCEITEVIGKSGDMNYDMLAIIQEYNIMAPYTEEEVAKADHLKPREIERRDLTSHYAITIDPHDAKDFDDSISYVKGKTDKECVIGIHIADVAAWIAPGGYFDKEARERGFTAYIPGNTLPMLPKGLTKKISLTEGKVSLAHSVILTVNKETGEIKDYKRFRSTVQIKKRLNFDQVEAYIKKKKTEEDWDKKLIENLDNLIAVYRAMKNYRDKNEKFLDLSTIEIRVIRDDSTGEILGIERKKQGEADQLVEEYMLAANSAVAKEMTNRKIPGIYRVHPEPDEDKREEFSNFVEDVFKIGTGDLSSGRGACKTFLAKIVNKNYQEIVTAAFLRALNRALYSEKSGLHYGLGKGLYSHFTSPIRRYSDLTVHQQLWDIDIKKPLRREEEMVKIAVDCTEKEQNTDEAYFAANDRLKLHYLQKLMNNQELEIYEGIIRYIGSTYIFADIMSIGISACIPTRYLEGYYKKSKGKLSATKGSVSYKPGDFIFLQLEKIDFIKGNAIFHPIQY